MSYPDLDIARKAAETYINEDEGYLHQIEINEDKIKSIVDRLIDERKDDYFKVSDRVAYARRTAIETVRSRKDAAKRNLIPYGV